MKRRDFFTVAGIGAGTVLAGSAGRVMAADKPKEGAVPDLEMPEVRLDC